jgi:hypothetical protein
VVALSKEKDMEETMFTTKEIAELLQKSRVTVLKYARLICPDKWISGGNNVQYSYDELLNIITFAKKNNKLKPEVIYTLTTLNLIEEIQ